MSNALKNPILNTDSYKLSHFMQYPPFTGNTFSYIESRGVGGNEDLKKRHEFEAIKVVHFGLQSYINQLAENPVTMEDVESAALFCRIHGVPFNLEGWTYIANFHKGFLPLSIRSVPEGTPVNPGVATVTISVTDPKCFWLASFIEPDILQNVWYGSTVATISREIKKIIAGYLQETSDNLDELPFKLHDFGFRGVSSRESAGLGGAAHLVNFSGTDTICGISYAQEHYGADVCGFSIPASEHSTMTSWGEDHEYWAYANMVKKYAVPGATFACVIDSYNVWEAIHMWASDDFDNKSLFDMVKGAGATVVLRPDSGDPVKTPVEVIDLLLELCGYTFNSKGYKVLPPHVRVIQGDGIDIDDVEAILWNLKQKGISASNIAFGMGGGLLQKVNRDTFKFAMKCSAVYNNKFGWKSVYKNPVGDKSKASKRGLLDTIRVTDEGYPFGREEAWGQNIKNTKLVTVSIGDKHHGTIIIPHAGTAMKTVYHAFGGDVTTSLISFDQVRENAQL